MPQLAAPSSNGRRRGLLKRFKKPRADSIGCDPESFATQITEYLDKATTLKAERAELEDFAAQRAARGDKVPAERAATEAASAEASAGESSDPGVATPARGSPPSTPEVSDHLDLRDVEQQREQARRDADAAAQAVREAEHQREEAERARVQARRDAEAAKQVIREVEQRRKEADLALVVARRDAAAAEQAGKNAEQQRQEAERQAREEAQVVVEAAARAAQETERHHREIEERTRGQAKRNAEAAEQALREAERQREQAEAARVQARRDAEAAERATKDAERQRQEAEALREQAARDTEAAEQAARAAREKAGREAEPKPAVKGARTAQPRRGRRKDVRAGARQDAETNTWEEISLSAVLAAEARADELAVLDGEIIAEPSEPSRNVEPSASPPDPLLEALDDELEALVEVVDESRATPSGVVSASPPTSSLSSAAEQSWLLRTIGQLRKDLSSFQRPGPRVGAAPVVEPPAASSRPVHTAVAQPRESDPAPVAPEPISPPVLSQGRSAPPLAAWAHRADSPALTTDDAVPTDDLEVAEGLLRSLRLPEHVAQIRYPAGCRIQRVRVAAGRRHRFDENDSHASVVILASRVLRDVREQSLQS